MNMVWPAATEWLGLFSEYLIKTTLVLFVCLLMVSLSRRQAAAVRHFLLSFFLIGLLLLPVFSVFRIGWETNLLPARTTGMEFRSAPMDQGPSEAGALRARPPAPMPEAAGRKLSEVRGILTASGPAVSLATGLSWFLGASLPFLWSAGLGLLLAKLSLGILGAYRLTREGIDVSDPSWRVLLARFLAAIRIRKTVRLKSHAGIGVPITWGLFRPVILLPPGHEDWPEDQRSSALLHELGHVKRADFLVLFLVRLSLAVFWFNPLCWIVFRRIKQEQERACDELVLTAGIRPSTYAATLLLFKRTAGCRHNVSAAFLGLFGSASFHERLAAILRQKLTLKEVTMRTKLTIAVAAILAVSVIGLARPSAAVPETPLASSLLIFEAPETAVVPVQLPAVAAGNNDQEKRVEAAKEQAKKAEEQKRTIVITNKQGEKVPIEIITTRGDATGRIKVARALTLKKGAEGEIILVDADGKELRALKGEPLRMTVEGKDLTIIREGSAFRIEKGDQLYLIPGKDKEEARVRVALRRLKAVDESGAEKFAVYVQNRTDEQPRLYRLAVGKAAEVKAKLSELSENLLQIKEKETEKAQLQKVIERLKATRKTPTEKPAVKIMAVRKPKTLIAVKPKVAGAAGSKLYVMDAGKEVMTVWIADGTGFAVLFGVGAGEGKQQIYERVLARVKQELPAGYAVEPEFNEKSGDVTLIIFGPEPQPVSTELIKKVAEVIRAEIK